VRNFEAKDFSEGWMDTEAGSSRKSETVKRQRAACTRPEGRKIERGFEAKSI